MKNHKGDAAVVLIYIAVSAAAFVYFLMQLNGAFR